MSDLPPVPKGLSLKRLKKAFTSLRQRLSLFRSSEITSELAGEIARSVSPVLRGAPLYNVYGSIWAHEGSRLTEALIDHLAHQLSGRFDELVSQPLQAYLRPTKSGWSAGQITDMQYCRWKDDRAGRIMRLRTLVGQSAGNHLTVKLPESYLRRLAYELAFGRRMTYDDDPRQFLGFVCWYWVSPDVESGTYDILSFGESSWMRKWNRELAKKRSRFSLDLPEDPCPHQYPHLCWGCKAVDCPAVIHTCKPW